jgi:SAM-dependent methyltransferase
MTVDPTAFRSELLDVDHFDRRFSADNVAFWVPAMVDAAEIGPPDTVLDVGCGTGGFAAAIAETTGASVTGLERSEAFLARARDRSSKVEWVHGDAELLPFADATFTCVLLSLVLHQLAEPERCVAEVARVLRPHGRVLVRTIAPADVRDRIPERYLPAMAAADAARLPELETIERRLSDAGLSTVRRERVFRDKELDLDDQVRELRAEVAGRYRFIPAADVDAAIEQMRKEAAGGRWIDPRPTWLLVATRLP